MLPPEVVVEAAVLAAFCKQRRITRLAIFGPVLLDDFGAQDEIAVLVEFEAGSLPAHCFALIEQDVTDLFDWTATVVTAHMLTEAYRAQVEAEAIDLYSMAPP